MRQEVKREGRKQTRVHTSQEQMDQMIRLDAPRFQLWFLCVANS